MTKDEMLLDMQKITGLPAEAVIEALQAIPLSYEIIRAIFLKFGRFPTAAEALAFGFCTQDMALDAIAAMPMPIIAHEIKCTGNCKIGGFLIEHCTECGWEEPFAGEGEPYSNVLHRAMNNMQQSPPTTIVILKPPALGPTCDAIPNPFYNHFNPAP